MFADESLILQNEKEKKYIKKKIKKNNYKFQSIILLIHLLIIPME